MEFELEINDSAYNNIKGQVSESFIISKLVEEGFLVRKIVKKGLKFNGAKIISPFVYLNNKALEDLFKDINPQIVNELLDFFKENLKGLPDLICVKDKTISFVEVKSNNCSLTPEQEIVMGMLKNKGYQYNIRRVNVELSLNEIN